MTKDDALKMALEAMEDVQAMMTTSNWFNDRVEAVRQALDQLPDTTKMIDTGTDRGAWSDVPDATKWVDELRGGDEEWTPDDMAYRPGGLSLEEPPTDAQIIAGAIFDFAGFLTTRDKVIKVGSTANAAPVADLVKEWADMRKLSLDDAAVSWWQDVLEEPPNSTKPVGEIIEAQGLIAVSIPEMPPVGTKLYATPSEREWVGLTDDELPAGATYEFDRGVRWAEAKLKEKNT